MNAFIQNLPADNRQCRESLYRGGLFKFAKCDLTIELVAIANALLKETFADVGSPRTAQFHLDSQRMYERIGSLRKQIYTNPRFLRRVVDIMTRFGFLASENRFDPARLRVVPHKGHENPKAAPVYYPHRDTWYANPLNQITWWIPLHDVEASETFEIYPEYLKAPVANNSEIFNYQSWMRDGWSRKIGWQNRKRDNPSDYPILQQDIKPQVKVPISCKAGDLVLFAGAHLHATLKHEVGRTRFSLDFRTVHIDDLEAGIGAPNVDNRSQGTTFHDHVKADHIDAWPGLSQVIDS